MKKILLYLFLILSFSANGFAKETTFKKELFDKAQAEDGIRDVERSRGLGDVYKRQIFPAIIFPAIFLDNSGSILIEDNPKIMAALIATLIGIFSRSIIATIFSGLASYWFLIFVV